MTSRLQTKVPSKKNRPPKQRELQVIVLVSVVIHIRSAHFLSNTVIQTPFWRASIFLKRQMPAIQIKWDPDETITGPFSFEIYRFSKSWQHQYLHMYANMKQGNLLTIR